LKNLLQDALSGRIAPAPFQRPYVWSKHDVLALLESILRGYPVGSLLLWTPVDAADLQKFKLDRIGPVPAEMGQEALSLLLDGQNRLATLAWLAKGPEIPLPDDLTDAEASVWANCETLVLDLVAKQFKFVSAEERQKGLVLPAYVVTDSRLANQTVRKCWNTQWADIPENDRNRALKNLDDCSNSFSNVQMTITHLERATVAEAKDAFIHICKVGVPVSEEDFDRALNF
jgi:hypothetical protein